MGNSATIGHVGATTLAPPMILKVDPSGWIKTEDAEAYMIRRRSEVARRLEALVENSKVKRWFESFTDEDLYKDGSAGYLGNDKYEKQSKEALHRARETHCFGQRVSAVEEFILAFCGFADIRAKYIVNAVHFQFAVDIDKLLSTKFGLPNGAEGPTTNETAIFDEAEIALAELLLRVVVQTQDGLVANPFSPGPNMRFLAKLPLFAQLILVLTNAVEAECYQQSMPDCPMAINLYASLLADDSPVKEMVGGAKIVEVMEMTRGATRGSGVINAVAKIRTHGAKVMLDDFDLEHPARGSSAHGIKVSVMANAIHSLQALRNDGAPFEEHAVEKMKMQDGTFMHFYHCLLPQNQPDIEFIVLEGSENCVKSEVSPGPALNYGEKNATIASAHVYQTAARAWGTKIKLLHQGGRALYDDEAFDEDASHVLARLGQSPQIARASLAGTFAWMGGEAERRASMRFRLGACGVIKIQEP